MSDPNQPRDWTDIDADADSETFVTAMQSVADMDPVERYKRQSHQLLRPGPGDRILDVGCGPGHDVVMLAEHVGNDGMVVGVDNSAAMIESAQEAGADQASVRFEVDDAVDLSFDDDSFDAARADRVLQHLESPRTAIEELRRVTRPGGWVGLSDSDWETIFIDTPTGQTEQFLDLEYAPNRTPTMGRQLLGLAQEVGLENMDILPMALHGTEYDLLEQAVLLQDWTDAMIEGNEVTEEAVEAWIDGLQKADERDRLLAGITVFTVAGQVPTEG